MENPTQHTFPKWAIVAIIAVIAFGILASAASMLIGGMVGRGVKRAMTTDEGRVQYQQDADGNTEVQWQGDDGSTGSIVTGGGSLPAAFPADFPVYAGAKVTASYVAADGDGKQVQYVTWETGDSTAAVEAFYRAQLDAKGWVISASGAANDAMNLVFNRAEGEDGGWISISRVDEGTTNITLALSVASATGN